LQAGGKSASRHGSSAKYQTRLELVGIGPVRLTSRLRHVAAVHDPPAVSRRITDDTRRALKPAGTSRCPRLRKLGFVWLAHHRPEIKRCVAENCAGQFSRLACFLHELPEDVRVLSPSEVQGLFTGAAVRQVWRDLHFSALDRRRSAVYEHAHASCWWGAGHDPKDSTGADDKCYLE